MLATTVSLVSLSTHMGPVPLAEGILCVSENKSLEQLLLMTLAILSLEILFLFFLACLMARWYLARVFLLISAVFPLWRSPSIFQQ